MRSEIKLADYNPRVISEEGRKALKRSIKLYGVVGGIVVNKGTGNTVVGGHQKVGILDELNKYDSATHENDYRLRVELIDIDLKTEKQLNVTLNNPNVGGEWDFDKLRMVVADIDYRDAGLTEVDLNLIGCDYMLQTDDEADMAGALSDMMAPVVKEREEDKAERALERAEKVAHMKEVKRQVQEDAQRKAENMDAYVMLSFDTFEAKSQFCERFGFSPYEKILKGEVFDEMVERVE